jgi:hypothetical protein
MNSTTLEVDTCMKIIPPPKQQPAQHESHAHLQQLACAVAQVGQVDAAAILADDELGASLPGWRVRPDLHQRLHPAAPESQAQSRMLLEGHVHSALRTSLPSRRVQPHLHQRLHPAAPKHNIVISILTAASQLLLLSSESHAQ